MGKMGLIGQMRGRKTRTDTDGHGWKSKSNWIEGWASNYFGELRPVTPNYGIAEGLFSPVWSGRFSKSEETAGTDGMAQAGGPNRKMSKNERRGKWAPQLQEQLLNI